MAGFYAVIERIPDQRHELDLGLVLLHHRLQRQHDGLDPVGIPAGCRAEGGFGHEITVKRHDRQDGVGQPRRVMAVGAHQAAGMFLSGVIAIHNGNFIAMAHGTQGEKQLGAQDGVYVFQHRRILRNF